MIVPSRRSTLLTMLFFAIGAFTSGCYREVRVTKQMTWECRPEEDRADYPGVQTVLFRYVENPSYHELEPGQHLCDILKASGKPVAQVGIVVFGDPWDGMRGYRTETVNGKAFVSGGGWGNSGWQGDFSSQPDKFPLDGLIPKHRLY